MGRFVEAMRDFWEGVGGFLSLGFRDVGNRISLLVRSFVLRRCDKSLASQQIQLGRKAWDLRVLSSGSFAVVESVESLERAVSAKLEACNEVKSRVEELRQQRQDHIAIYQQKLTEQLKMKQPVDAEHTSQLLEVKRLRRELASTREQIAALENKHKLQTKRLEEFGDAKGEGSEEYIRTDIEHEIEYIVRSLALKREKADFLSVRLDEQAQGAERSGKVAAQFEAQIAELRKRQREGTAKYDVSLRKLEATRRRIERDIKRLRREMIPLFGELGAELRRRPFDHPELTKEYAEIARLEREREEQAREVARLRSDSASIGIGIKVGFYSLSLLLIVLIIWLFVIIL